MRLLIVTRELPPGPGGIGAHADGLARAAADAAWDVTVIAPQDYVTVAEGSSFNASAPYQVEVVPTRRGLGRARSLAERVRALRRGLGRRPDLVVASGEWPIWLMGALARRTTWIAVLHGSEIRTGISWWLTRTGARRASSIACVSEHTRRLAIAGGAPMSKTTVIPNGAETVPTSMDERAEARRFRDLHGLADDPLVVTVGRVSERKGQDRVVRALPSIVERVRTARYLVIGIDWEAGPLRELARSLEVEEHVRILGRVTTADRLAALAACEVFVMLSRTTDDGDTEGFGIAVAEASHFGKPSVVAHGTGAEEAVAPGGGLVVDGDDPEDVAAAVAGLLADDQLRRRMGRVAQEWAAQHQTWAAAWASYESCAERPS